MKKTKKTLIALLLISIVFLLTVLAHSGRTDGDGGHWNHSTGEYHYHHGESAHQHPNGICPYEQDDDGGNKVSSFLQNKVKESEQITSEDIESLFDTPEDIEPMFDTSEELETEDEEEFELSPTTRIILILVLLYASLVLLLLSPEIIKRLKQFFGKRK